jgi:hypothetical protein
LSFVAGSGLGVVSVGVGVGVGSVGVGSAFGLGSAGYVAGYEVTGSVGTLGWTAPEPGRVLNQIVKTNLPEV